MSHRVRIRHPGYTGPNTLFTLPASDGLERNRAHYATVKAVSSIITNEVATIWLSKTAKGDEPVEPDTDGLIPAGDYFLQVAQDDSSDKGPYSIVPNFHAWPFPHGALPLLWKQASRKDLNVTRTSEPTSSLVAGESCRITKKFLACDDSHILPASEKPWFTSNEMDQYGQLSGRTGEAVADTSVNMMRLRIDAHRLWDNLQISIVAREDNCEAEDAAWFIQMMNEGEELYQDWHGRKLQSLAGRSPEYLYARFAWDIFPKLHGFLQAGQPRRLTVRGPDGSMVTRAYGPTECRDFTVGQGRGRSASPTKRARSVAGSVYEPGANNDFHLHDRPHCPHDDDTAPKPPSFDSAIADVHDEYISKHWPNHGSGYTCKCSASEMSSGQEWARPLCDDDSDTEQGRGRKRQRL